MSHTCDICFQDYQRRGSLLRHQRRIHNLFQYKCEHCEFGSNWKHVLIQHLRAVHNFVPSDKKPKKEYENRLVCPCCKNRDSKTFIQLGLHLKEKHNVSLNKEKYSFCDVNNFHKWKKETEANTRSQYVAINCQRKVKTKNCVRKEYVCHRSYNGKKLLQIRRRLIKSLGSNKLDVTCPSRMIVDEESSGQVNVIFFRQHVGHECEIIRTRIPPDERAVIAEKIKEGASIDSILQDIRKRGLETNCERMYYTSRKDIHNIARDYKLDYHLLKRGAAKTQDFLGALTQRLTNSKLVEEIKNKLQLMLDRIDELRKAELTEDEHRKILYHLDEAFSFFNRKPVSLFEHANRSEDNSKKELDFHPRKNNMKLKKTSELSTRPLPEEGKPCVQTLPDLNLNFVEVESTNFHFDHIY